MLDDDIKSVEKLRDSLFSSLKNPDGSWKKEKHNIESKELCQDIRNDIEKHCKTCNICKKSMDEYIKMKISNTPPCNMFGNYMKEHIKICPICNTAQNKWNEDAIPITPELRKAITTLYKLKGLCGL